MTATGKSRTGSQGLAAGRGLSLGLNGLLAVAFVVVAVAGNSRNEMAHADEAMHAPVMVAVDANGLAANGHDVVAFFIGDVAERGKAHIAAEHHGVTYRFANTRNRDTFLTHPQAFLPQFGGYGAMAVREGYKLRPGSEMIWQIEDNRLYFFRNAEARDVWNARTDANAAIARKIWAEIRDLPPAMLTAEPGI